MEDSNVWDVKVKENNYLKGTEAVEQVTLYIKSTAAKTQWINFNILQEVSGLSGWIN